MPKSESYQRYGRTCTNCGGRIQQDVAEVQYRQLNLTEGTSCRECIEEGADREVERLKDALNEENTEKLESLSRDDQILMVMKLSNNGTIHGDSTVTPHKLRQQAVLFQLDENGGDDQ